MRVMCVATRTTTHTCIIYTCYPRYRLCVVAVAVVVTVTDIAAAGVPPAGIGWYISARPPIPSPPFGGSTRALQHIKRDVSHTLVVAAGCKAADAKLTSFKEH